MPTIKEAAIAYEGKAKTKIITELDKVSTTLEITETEMKGKNGGQDWVLKTICVDGEDYRIPDSVISAVKVMLEDNPNLKEFKVKSQGLKMDTTYTVIPLL